MCPDYTGFQEHFYRIWNVIMCVCVCVIQEGILNQSNLKLICQPGNMWWMAWRQEGSRNFDNVIFILRSMQSKHKMFAFIYFTTAVHWLHKNSIIKRMTLALANRIVFRWKSDFVTVWVLNVWADIIQHMWWIYVIFLCRSGRNLYWYYGSTRWSSCIIT